jgi:serine/threonine-protein kinase
VGHTRALGKYRIVAELARGGMGIVYLALMRGPGAFNKLLVLKELKPEFLEDPAMIAMFLEEARLAACLGHPNVVQTLEAASEGHRHYIAMEYLDGQSLHRVLGRARRRGAAVPFEWKSAVLCSALEGLAYAHSALDYDGKPLGIVHRDMSPHNVFVGYDGQTKVLDFGIAKGANSAVETRTGLLKGKIAYMSPEQAAVEHVDARADVFAMGVMLWEAATDRRFWSGMDSDVQILRTLLRGYPRSAREQAISELPAGLRPVIARATALDASERHANARELLADYREALSRGRVPQLQPEAVGCFAQELFAEDRARLQVAIDDALRASREATATVSLFRRGSSDAEVPRLTDVNSDVTPSNLPGLPAAGSGGSSLSMGAAPVFVAGASGFRSPLARGGLLGGALVAALVAVVAPAAFWRGAGGTPPAAALPPATPASAAVDGRDPAAAEKVHLTVRAPPSARIVVDHQVAIGNPAIVTLPKDGASHSVHVEADGYLPRDDTFSAIGDGTLIIALERKAPLVRIAPARAGSPAAIPAASTADSVASVVSAPPPPPPTAPTGTAANAVPQRRINMANPYAD